MVVGADAQPQLFGFPARPKVGSDAGLYNAGGVDCEPTEWTLFVSHGPVRVLVQVGIARQTFFKAAVKLKPNQSENNLRFNRIASSIFVKKTVRTLSGFSSQNFETLLIEGKKMTEFEVKGPFQVPLRKQKTGGIVISEDKLPDLFESCSSFNTLGCYVFSRKSGRGSTPVYVGMTHRTIAKEAFNSSNLKKVENWLNEQNHRKLQIWTVTQKSGTKKNRSAVSEIETTLITWAKQENPNLLNIQKSKRKERWTIYGVNSHGRGKVSNTSKEFKRMIGFS